MEHKQDEWIQAFELSTDDLSSDQLTIMKSVIQLHSHVLKPAQNRDVIILVQLGWLAYVSPHIRGRSTRMRPTEDAYKAFKTLEEKEREEINERCNPYGLDTNDEWKVE